MMLLGILIYISALHNKSTLLTFLFLSPPNSKCLHLLMASILLDLQLGSTHSSLNTIFFVVLAWKHISMSDSLHTSIKVLQAHETWPLPFYGKLVLFGHRTHSVFCRISSYLQTIKSLATDHSPSQQ